MCINTADFFVGLFYIFISFRLAKKLEFLKIMYQSWCSKISRDLYSIENCRPQYDILCLGIDGAGKSSILAVACQEPLEEVQPTDGIVCIVSKILKSYVLMIGFSIKAVQLSGMVFNVKEVAGMW